MDELVRALGEKETVEEFKEVNMRIRPIPDITTPHSLDPRVKEVFLTTKSFGSGETLEQIRQSMGWDNIDLSGPGIRTIDKMIPSDDGEIRLRIYRKEPDENLPCIVFFHGGGFFGGSLKTVENPCKLLAERINGVVVSVEYRLAPEHPYPKGFNDCFNAIKWVYENADEIGINPDMIGVSGDSAGGNLATVCALKDRDLKLGMVKYQALIYPVVNVGDHSTPEYKWDEAAYPAREEDASIAMTLARSIGESKDLLINLYLQGDETKSKERYVSPFLLDDLTGMPPAIIIVAEYDYLRIQGELYAAKLKKAGTEVDLLKYSGTDHAFIDKLGDYPQAEDCMNEIAKGFLQALKQVK